MRAEEQDAKDDLDDVFLNRIMISCNQVLWIHMLSSWCSLQAT